MSKTPIIPENAPFTAAQRLWLNGFLAGLFSQEECARAEPSTAGTQRESTRLLILFGSQTGTAEGLARRLAAEASRRGFLPRVMDADAATKIDWGTETHLLVITSTYGDGDMPDNAAAFWNWLQTDAAEILSQLQYSVLALGDSNYEHFCAAGKKIDARLEQLGARRLYPRTDCDTDYDAPAKAWTEQVIDSLGTASGSGSAPRRLGISESSAPSNSTLLVPQSFSRTNHAPAVLLAGRRLSGEGSAKEVRHFEISFEGSGLSYEPGDALGVQPINCPTVVDELLRALHCDGEEAVPGPGVGEISLRKALSEHYDITKPGIELVRRMANGSGELRALLAPERAEELKRRLRGHDITELMLEMPGFRPAPPDFVGLLKPLAPRFYSIASSPKVHSGQAHLTVGIVRHESHGRAHKGVCSTFLAERVPAGGQVLVFVQPSHRFRLPASGDTPIIMVGPGTGVAPFRGFLHERQALGAKGRNWLFFGEQHAATDFYYREELEEMVRSGHLTRLSTAFSRDQAEKVYVQHRMLEQAAELWAWLQEGAHFYVCGDASRMARDVDAALHRVLEIAGRKSVEEAAEFVNQIKSEKRYQRDVY